MTDRQYPPPADKVTSTSSDQIAEVRRWLWEQFNVRQDHRPRPPALATTLWGGNPIIAARSFGVCLAELVEEGHVAPQDVTAWVKAASLSGRRTPKRDIATTRGSTERGLHNRLRKVDAELVRQQHFS